MIEKYKSEVLRFYEQQRESGELCTNLVFPTPAKICKEVRWLLSTGCSNADLQTLKDFLDVPFSKPLIDVSYKKWDVDKFRPLCTFLKRNINTREKNIELLAWLIDFNPRPYSNFCRVSKGKKDVLSTLTISENGIVNGTNKRNKLYNEHSLASQLGINESNGNGYSDLGNRSEIAKQAKSENDDYSIPKEIRIEFPSGLKLFVNASEFSLVAKELELIK